jgi:hypothetical protein
VKIEPVELSTFNYDDLVIDPYWNDLYNPETKKKNIKIK